MLSQSRAVAAFSAQPVEATATWAGLSRGNPRSAGVPSASGSFSGRSAKILLPSYPNPGIQPPLRPDLRCCKIVSWNRNRMLTEKGAPAVMVATAMHRRKYMMNK